MPPTLAARLAVLGAALLFSTGGAAIKAIELSGWQVACLRSGIAALAVLLLLPAARNWPRLPVIAVGAVYAATMILFVSANKLTTAANAIYLQSTAPLYLLLLGPWLLREPIRRRDLWFMLAIAAGMGLFFVGTEPPRATATAPLLGNILATTAGVTWALTVVGLRALGRLPTGATVQQNLAADTRSAQAVVTGNVIAFLVCLPMALPVTSMRPVDAVLLGYLGVFQIGLAYVFLTVGLRRVPALEASLLLFLEPVLNPVWAWLVHGERPGSWAAAGGGLIMATTLIKTWFDRRG
jgi:drug/metabolite transporter (DMT)-like permease